MDLLQLLSTLGVPAFVLTFAAILWILKTVGLLDWATNIIKTKIESEEKGAEATRKERAELQRLHKLQQLSADYSDNWLLEQISQYSSEALVQVGTSNEFIRKEVYETLKALIEKMNQLDILIREVSSVRVRLGEIYTEIDLINRRLEEMSRTNERDKGNT